MITNKRNGLIDLTKLFFSICIVFIHTGLSDKIPYGFEIKELIFRLGIPFFFVCSGYFFAKNNINTGKKLYLYLKRIFIPFIFFSIIYILCEAYFLGEGSYNYIVLNVSKMFLGSPSVVTWYSGSIIWTFIILYFIKDKRKLLYVILISLTLYLVGLSFTTYDFILNGFNPLLLMALKNTFIQNRSFWFVGLLYVSIGYSLEKYSKLEAVKTLKLIIALIISFVFCYIETTFIKGKTLYFEFDFLISHILVVVILFMLTIKCSKLNFNSKFIRNLSTTVYYIHFLIIYIFRYLIDNSYVKLNQMDIAYDLIILGITILLAVILNKIPSKNLKKIIN